MWHLKYVKWLCVGAAGSAGGIMLLWDSRPVSVLHSWSGEFSLSIVVKDLEGNR